MLLGCVFIVTQVARVNGPAVFEKSKKKESKSASKEERSMAFTLLSGHEGKRKKRKGR